MSSVTDSNRYNGKFRRGTGGYGEGDGSGQGGASHDCRCQEYSPYNTSGEFDLDCGHHDGYRILYHLDAHLSGTLLLPLLKRVQTH